MYKPGLMFKTYFVAFTAALLLGTAQLAACASAADDFNKRLGLGINLGNALEAPKEGEWGLTIKPEYLKAIKSAGFSHVRIPICWSAHAGAQAPYTIEPEFLLRVDEVVHEALSDNLMVIINMHHYEEFEKDPDKQKDRFFSIWNQIAQHFHDLSPNVAFEIYNEPCKGLTDEKWNPIVARALQIIRASNPDRFVVVGPTSWNNIYTLGTLELPESDTHLIATIHYYEPFHFTHQGATWVGVETKSWLGTKWMGDWKERLRLATNFDIAKQWSDQHKRPIYLGEFGAFSKADMDSRARWTRTVCQVAGGRGFSAAYWEFGSGFGAYDIEHSTWRAPLLSALIDGWKSVRH
jgi:endoglucanase